MYYERDTSDTILLAKISVSSVPKDVHLTNHCMNELMDESDKKTLVELYRILDYVISAVRDRDRDLVSDRRLSFVSLSVLLFVGVITALHGCLLAVFYNNMPTMIHKTVFILSFCITLICCAGCFVVNEKFSSSIKKREDVCIEDIVSEIEKEYDHISIKLKGDYIYVYKSNRIDSE